MYYKTPSIIIYQKLLVNCYRLLIGREETVPEAEEDREIWVLFRKECNVAARTLVVGRIWVGVHADDVIDEQGRLTVSVILEVLHTDHTDRYLVQLSE
jgi:hypothetical protein